MRAMVLFLALTQLTAIEVGFCGGRITLSGVLKSITETQYVIERSELIYYIERKAVPQDQAEKLVRPENYVSLTLPFEAIETVKPKGRK